MDWITTSPIAHRGWHDGSTRPENSISAIQAAIEQEIPIECDVRQLADGTVVVFHDRTLQRMTGASGLLVEQTLDTLKDLRLLNTDQTIPTLSEVLACVQSQVPILIEIKNEGMVGPLEEAVGDILATYSGNVAVQSFNPYSLEWFNLNAPQIWRGQLAGEFKNSSLPWYQAVILKNLWLNWASNPHFIAYELNALPNWPTAIARQVYQLPILAWTIRNQADQAKACQYADNYIFDRFEGLTF